MANSQGRSPSHNPFHKAMRINHRHEKHQLDRFTLPKNEHRRPKKKIYICIYIYIQIDLNRSLGHRFEHISGQIMIFHQPGFFLNKGISLPELPFGVRSCEVAITWPDIYIYTHTHTVAPPKKKKKLCFKNSALYRAFIQVLASRFWGIFLGGTILILQFKKCNVMKKLKDWKTTPL